MTPIAPHIEAYLRDPLGQQRGASPHTCESYAYSFQRLFAFTAKRLKRSPLALTVEHMEAALIAAFLEHLEDGRRNASSTRNIRLAAIRSFFHFLEYREPAALEQIRRILAIPYKKTDSRLVPYLEQEEVHLFVFLNRRRNRIKLLVWDRTGYLVAYKRLERGTFCLPTAPAPGDRHVEMDAGELALMLEGVDLRGAVRRERWRRVPSGSSIV